MAVLLAGALLAASIFQPLARDAGDAYDDAAVETSAEATPTESAPGALSVDASNPHAYLYSAYPRYAKRLDCVITRESHWLPAAVNPRSGATGLAQFLASTWASTPQGKAGYTRTNPYASIDGAVFLIENTPQGWKHWAVIGLC